MILVRETLVAKPGNASKLAKLMKEVFHMRGENNTKVMTDMTGEYNQVVMETEYDSLTDLEKEMQEYQKASDWKDKMKGYTDMYLVGKREVFQLW